LFTDRPQSITGVEGNSAHNAVVLHARLEFFPLGSRVVNIDLVTLIKALFD
jgi:hypothetical protein